MPRRRSELPPLTALVAFEAAARGLSVKDAARELNVTPGAISKQVKLLEQEAGVPLFVRGHRALALTEAGRLLLEAITAGFETIAGAFGRIRNQAAGTHAINLASNTAFAQMWLMPRLGRFLQAHPDVTINHVLSDRDEGMSWNRVNLRIRYGGGIWPGETGVKLFDDRIYPVCAPKFASAHKARSLSDLARLPLLQLQDVDPTWTTWNGWLRLAGVSTRGLRVRSFSSYFVLLQAAVDGQGVALGWHRLVGPLVAQRKLRTIGNASVPAPHSYYLTWKDEGSLPQAADAFRKWLSDEASSCAAKDD